MRPSRRDSPKSQEERPRQAPRQETHRQQAPPEERPQQAQQKRRTCARYTSQRHQAGEQEEAYSPAAPFRTVTTAKQQQAKQEPTGQPSGPRRPGLIQRLQPCPGRSPRRSGHRRSFAAHNLTPAGIHHTQARNQHYRRPPTKERIRSPPNAAPPTSAQLGTGDPATSVDSVNQLATGTAEA